MGTYSVGERVVRLIMYNMRTIARSRCDSPVPSSLSEGPDAVDGRAHGKAVIRGIRHGMSFPKGATSRSLPGI